MAADLIADYLMEKKILILDSSGTIRTTISNVLHAMGAMKTNILTFKDYDQARQQIEEDCPQIIITEFSIQDKLGMSLLPLLHANHPDSLQRIFMVMSASPEQTALSLAAEEEIDSFVIKPFQYNYLLENISRTIMGKIKPSEYSLKIREGKSHLFEENYDTALHLFSEAVSLNKKPALAKYYLGKTFMEMGEPAKAVKAFHEGLKIIPKHFRCMEGFYEALKAEDRKLEAYKVLTQITKNFPASPRNLKDLFELAKDTGNYSDLDTYFELFVNIEGKSAGLITHVKNAYFSYGQMIFEKSGAEEAFGAFDKGILASGIDYDYIKSIILYFIENKQTKYVKDFIAKMKQEDRQTSEFYAFEFYLESFHAEDVYLIEKGRKLIKQGIQDKRIYRVMLGKLMARKSFRAAENLVYDAIQYLPDSDKEEFKILAEKIESLAVDKSSGLRKSA